MEKVAKKDREKKGLYSNGDEAPNSHFGYTTESAPCVAQPPSYIYLAAP